MPRDDQYLCIASSIRCLCCACPYLAFCGPVSGTPFACCGGCSSGSEAPLLEVPCPITCALWLVVYPLTLCLSYVTPRRLVYAGSFYWGCPVEGPTYDEDQWDIHSEGDPSTMWCRCCDVTLSECLSRSFEPCSECISNVRTIRPPPREIMVDTTEGPPLFSLSMVYVLGKFSEWSSARGEVPGDCTNAVPRSMPEPMVYYDRMTVDSRELAKRLRSDPAPHGLHLSYIQKESFELMTEIVYAMGQPRMESVSLLRFDMGPLDRFVAALPGSYVKEFNLENCFKYENSCGDTAIKEISAGLMLNNSVEKLNLYANAVIDCQPLCWLLSKQGSKIRKLDLGSNKIAKNEQNDSLLGEMLLTSTSLEMLLMDSCFINDIGRLCQGLAMNTSLQVLDLSHNQLGPKQGEYLGEMLRRNNSLKTLKVLGDTNGRLDSKGCKAIFDGLAVNHSLETLVLSRQSAKMDGGMAAAKMLRKNSTLRTLILDENHIPQPAMIAIVDALKSNSRLQVLVLGRHRSDINAPVPARTVADMLKHNSSLLSLVLTSVMEPRDSHLIATALLSNNTLISLDISRNDISVLDCLEFVGVLAGCQAKPLRSPCPSCGAPANQHPLPGAQSLLYLELDEFICGEVKRHERQAKDHVLVTATRVMQRNSKRCVREITSAVLVALSPSLADIVFGYLTEEPHVEVGRYSVSSRSSLSIV